MNFEETPRALSRTKPRYDRQADMLALRDFVGQRLQVQMRDGTTHEGTLQKSDAQMVALQMAEEEPVILEKDEIFTASALGAGN